MVKSLLKYVLMVIAAAYFGLLVMVILTNPVRLLFNSERTSDIVSSVICIISSMVMLYFGMIKHGYSESPEGKSLINKMTVVQIVCGVVVYIIITVILRYYTGAATHVYELSQHLGDLQGLNIKEMAREHGGFMFITLVLVTVPFIPSMIVGYIVGSMKRRKERQNLHNF